MNHSLPITIFGLTMLYTFVIPTVVYSADELQRDANETQCNAMDTNRDGQLSPDEHTAGARKIFTMDANKDGVVLDGPGPR